MKKIVFLLLFQITCFICVFSQGFKNFTAKIDPEKNLTKLESYKKEELEKFNRTNNKYHLYNVYYIESQMCLNNKDENGSLKKLIWITEDCPNCETEQFAWLYYHLATTLSTYNSGLSIEFALKSIRISRKKNYNDITPWPYSMLGITYYNDKNFIEAKKYFSQARKFVQPSDTVMSASMLNNIGLCYMNMKQNREAYTFFKRSLKVMESIKKPTSYSQNFKIVVEGNIGTILNHLGKEDEAMKLLEKEIAYNFHNKTYSEAVNPLCELLLLYQKNNSSTDENRIIEKIKFVENLNETNEVAPKLTEALYTYYLQKKKQSEALFYSQKLVSRLKMFSDYINKKSNEQSEILYFEKVAHLKKESNAQKKILNYTISDKKQSQTISVILIVLFLILSVSSGLIIREKNKRSKTDRIIFEQRKQIEINRSTILENEIKLKQEKITSLALNLNLKKETEKAFLEKIKEIKRKRNVEVESVLKELQLSVSNLLQIDNKNFINNQESDEENAKFVSVLKEKHPQLTEQELSYCTYFRMNLNSKEIASLNNMASGTIRVYKTKIKAKIGLHVDQNLNEYLFTIS